MNSQAFPRGEELSMGSSHSDAAGPRTIGRSVIDPSDIEKATGRLKFADDLFFERMLYGAILLSDVPHGEIRSIETRDAELMPGVERVLTSKDVPGMNRFGLLIPDQPVLAPDRVRFVGEAVALVLADSEETAREAVRRIRVDVKPLPVIDSPAKALSGQIPPAHACGHILKRIVHEQGDIGKGFECAAVIVEQHYDTPFLEHAYIEPEAGTAVLTRDGRIEVSCPTQHPFSNRDQIAKILALPVEKVRVRGMPVGGGFGGKLDITIQALLALGALKTGRPVKITLTRYESFRMSTKRHPFDMVYRTGATSEGGFVALEATLTCDAGAYASYSTDVLEQAMLFGGGPYVWPNVRIEGICTYTNNVIGGAFRGFGMNQVHFAVESQIDMLAERLGIDPIDLRLRNALQEGKETIAGERLRSSVAIRETLSAARSLFREAKVLKRAEGCKRVGVGVASAYKNIGGGRGFVNKGGAALRLRRDGSVELRASICDMGQGACAILAQMASEVTGMRYEDFTVLAGDTDTMPPGTAAIGQRQTMLAGNATIGASKAFKKSVLAMVAEQTGLPVDSLQINGRRVVDQDHETVLSLPEMARIADDNGIEISAAYEWNAPRTYPLKKDPNPAYPIFKDGKRVTEYDPEDYRNYFAYDYATQIAVVEVDTRTGRVEVRKVIAIHDVGRALNPQRIREQLRGSVLMGIGYALSEEFVMRKGIPCTQTLGQCGIPTILSLPEIEIVMIEKPEPIGPFDAKGVSEIALVPTVPAIVNAIYDATGVRMTSLPVKPEKVLAALRRSEKTTT